MYCSVRTLSLKELAYQMLNIMTKAWCEDLHYVVFASLLLYNTAYYSRVWYSKNATGGPAESYRAVVAESLCYHTSVMALPRINNYNSFIRENLFV